MKKPICLILSIFIGFISTAQNITISFQSKNIGNKIDSIWITNQRTGQKVKILEDESLVLTQATGFNLLQANQTSGIIYPNPAEGKATFTFPTNQSQTVEVSLYNISGQRLSNNLQRLEPGTHSFNVQFPKAGLYTVSVLKNDGKETCKAVSTGISNQPGKIEYTGSVTSNRLKSAANEETMDYETGDVITYSLYSEGNTTIVADSPEETTQYTVEFFDCVDGGHKSYPVVKIGSQWWMAENLAYLPTVSPPSVGSNINPNYYVYDYNGTDVSVAKNSTCYSAYGVLYNWPAALVSCPSGWHLPSDNEWKQLETTLGMAQDQLNELEFRGTDQGLKMKAAIGWWEEGNGNNSSGFSGLPGGNRYSDGSFKDIGKNGVWWSSTENYQPHAYTRDLDHSKPEVFRFFYGISHGYSVRCVKDAGSGPSNRAPQPPSNPTPADNATSISLSPVLSWDCSDPDGDAIAYNIYFDTINPPVNIIKSNVSTNSYTLGGLLNNRDYYWKIKAYDDKGDAVTGPVWKFTTKPDPNACIDPDGRSYKTVQIGKQVWMAENLAYIPSSARPFLFSYSEPVCYVWGYVLKNIEEAKANDNYKTYGVLYNWIAAMAGEASSNKNPSRVQGICPSGWHLPSDAEWKQLEMVLGMTRQQADATGNRGTDQGTQMKTTSGWLNNGNGTNTSGFSGLPAGSFMYIHFVAIREMGCWWSSTEDSTNTGESFQRSLSCWNQNVIRYKFPKASGLSVRCVKDEGSGPSNQAPQPPSNPTPADNATGISLSPVLSWDCSDPDGDALTYNIYLDTVNPPVNVIGSNLAYDSIAISSLLNSKTYYWKVKASDDKGGSVTGPVWKFTTKSASTISCVDLDGYSYKTVQIGNQVWMAENLRTTKFNDGTGIPLVTDDNAWSNLTPAYCWFSNDEATNKDTYGAMYNWYVVNTGKLCPTGWHVPNDAEWSELTGYLGGESIAGGKLKETGTSHWGSPNTGATNETGFTGLPGGYRVNSGSFQYLGQAGYWWSSTESNNDALSLYLRYNNSKVSRNYAYKVNGYSVRCVKD